MNLKRANDHLRRIVREREDVLAIVAHDLKNPISNVRFAAQMLRRASSTADRQVSLIEDIVSCCDEAIEFIQRFLQRRAEIERLRSVVLAPPVDLGQLVERAIARQAVAAGAKNLTLSRSGEDPGGAGGHCRVAQRDAEPALQRHRYAPVGSEIETRIDADRPGHARVFVMDRGPGIPESERTKLFQRFVRIARTDSTVDDSLSTGLGLAIAKGDIEQMGGYLWYEPRQGGGSVFAFELPLAQAITA
ncbi:HAMP domain-containing sensor histidine kinase [Paucibacter sp. O1-1]|nr:HAMP domain-containing histidine kinase [Paucibacter sp. O1-1]MDA3831409.1 HAMP domain-containing sensor histidine kinase [Paucibacter sp. O1-1]